MDNYGTLRIFLGVSAIGPIPARHHLYRYPCHHADPAAPENVVGHYDGEENALNDADKASQARPVRREV